MKQSATFVPRTGRQQTGFGEYLENFESPLKLKIKVLYCNGNVFFFVAQIGLKTSGIKKKINKIKKALLWNWYQKQRIKIGFIDLYEKIFIQVMN